jgi:hypothetical protein
MHIYKADFPAKTWDYIIEVYGHLASVHPSFEPMHRFASRVKASQYSQGLFPAISMHTLLISQTAEFDRHHETLEINFDSTSQIFRFEYWEHPVRTIKRWTKECNADEGFEAFERFLQLKKWFA